MEIDIYLLIGLAALPVLVGLCVFAFKSLAVITPESHELLQLRFGKLHERSTEAGVGGNRLAPWNRWIVVSRQHDERVFHNIETNDSQGTLVKVDLRVTFRIVDSDRALFSVDDWEAALESVALHEASAELAGKDRTLFLRNAPELATELTALVKKAMAGYGIEVYDVRIANIELRPEVTRQMFETVAAKLEVAKAEYEEKGRTDAAMLLAGTEQRVAELEARAKTEHLKAVGRVYQELRQTPHIFEAYTDLYRLSQLDPSRVVSFDGFEEGELSMGSLIESDLELEKHEAGTRKGMNGHPAP